MSIQLIQQYYNHVDQLIRYGGTHNETSLRKAFQELLDHYARSQNLLLVPEVGVIGRRGCTVHPDRTLKDALRQDWGYWESKDEKDTLEDEIWVKFTRGYPDCNILFEDTHTAVLIQGARRSCGRTYRMRRRWNGSWSATRRRNARTRPSPRSSTPTTLQTTRKG